MTITAESFANLKPGAFVALFDSTNSRADAIAWIGRCKSRNAHCFRLRTVQAGDKSLTIVRFRPF